MMCFRQVNEVRMDMRHNGEASEDVDQNNTINKNNKHIMAITLQKCFQNLH